MRVKCRRRLPLKVALHIYPFELVTIISHREFINREYPLEDPKKTRPLFKQGMFNFHINFNSELDELHLLFFQLTTDLSQVSSQTRSTPNEVINR